MDRAATVANGYIGSKQEGRIGGSNQKNVPRILVFIMGGKYIYYLDSGQFVCLHIFIAAICLLFYFQVPLIPNYESVTKSLMIAENELRDQPIGMW